jgi:light-regulated signal transduction histidine kinase (bacteriophytochrome)
VASHDLQEPLRKVASFCQLLEKRYGDKLDDRGHQYIAFAVDGAKQLQNLINDLLTFSRVGRSGSARCRSRWTRRWMPRSPRWTPRSRNQAPSSTVLTGCPRSLVSSPLAMLWQNLIGNAIKFRAADNVMCASPPPRNRQGPGGSPSPTTASDCA